MVLLHGIMFLSSRKADLRELKMLQKVENRQYQDLVFKAQYMREQQEKKFEQEMQVNTFFVFIAWTWMLQCLDVTMHISYTCCS